MAGIFMKEDWTDIPTLAETTNIVAQTEFSPTDAVGTFSAPQPIYSLTPMPQSIPPDVMLISQVVWTKVVTQLVILTTKVGYMEGRVRSNIDRQFEGTGQVSPRAPIYIFFRITRQLGTRHMPNVVPSGYDQ